MGAVIASQQLATWGAPQLSAYLAAMVAERWASPRPTTPGTGTWFRSLAWFPDHDGRYGPPERPRMAFSSATLERGLAQLELEGLISHHHIAIDPRTKRHLQGRRNYYTNRFDTLIASPD